MAARSLLYKFLRIYIRWCTFFFFWEIRDKSSKSKKRTFLQRETVPKRKMFRFPDRYRGPVHYFSSTPSAVSAVNAQWIRNTVWLWELLWYSALLDPPLFFCSCILSFKIYERRGWVVNRYLYFCRPFQPRSRQGRVYILPLLAWS